MKTRIVAQLAFIAVFVSSGVPVGAAERLFAIQLASFPTQRAADEFKGALAETPVPLMVNERAGLRSTYQVFMGPYASYMDAWTARQALQEPFPQDAFVVTLDEQFADAKGEGADGAYTAHKHSSFPPLSSVRSADKREPSDFVMVTVPEAQSGDAELLQGKGIPELSRSELLVRGFNGKKNSEGIESLERFLDEFPDDPTANAVRVRLARRVLAQKKYDRFDELLNAVRANGSSEERQKAEIVRAYAEAGRNGARAAYDAFAQMAVDQKNDSDLRAHAMRMAAGHAHAAREYTSAVLCFRQLEAEAPSLEERQEAALQLCGLQFELVGRAKGSWDEVIESCDKLCDDPDVPQALKATANLMRFEAMFHAGYVQDALSACEAHLRLYPNIKREFISATTWHGALLVHVGRRQEAIPVLQSVLEMEISSSERFGGHYPKARAAYWLAFIALQQGDLASRDYYVNYIRENFAQSQEASKLAVLLPSF